MDYRLIYDHCHGNVELAEALCQKLNIPVTKRPEMTPEFKRRLSRFDHQNSVKEITALRKIAKSYQDLDELIDICFGNILPKNFIAGILDDMEKLATDFYLKVNVLDMASRHGLGNRYPQIQHWLLYHATFDQWITLYLFSPELSEMKQYAFEQMVHILDEAQIRPQDSGFYEEHLVSP